MKWTIFQYMKCHKSSIIFFHLRKCSIRFKQSKATSPFKSKEMCDCKTSGEFTSRYKTLIFNVHFCFEYRHMWYSRKSLIIETSIQSLWILKFKIYIISLLGSCNLVKYHKNATFHKPSLSCANVNLSFAPRSGPLNT